MKTKNLRAPALVLAFASTLLVLPAWANDSAKPSAETTAPAATKDANKDAQALMKFSTDGQSTVRDVSAARVAIFDGDPKVADDLIAKAKASLAKAETDAPNYGPKSTETVNGKMAGAEPEKDKAQMIPIDGQVALAEDFVPTPEKQAHIAKANEHFKKGETKEAIDELKLGQIDVSYNRVWMPLASAKTHLDSASKLMDDHKYYEANLSLKAISDSLQNDSVDLVGTPVKLPLETTTKN